MIIERSEDELSIFVKKVKKPSKGAFAMKKLIIFSFIFILLCKVSINYSQQVTTEWVINNIPGYPVGVMIGLDNNNNVFVTGQAGDHSKIITTKYDTHGNLIWQRYYSIQNLGVVATWLSMDPSGNIIITGYPRTLSSNPVEVGLLTLKYDNNGNLLWDKLISGTWAFAVRSIIDQSGNIFVTGRAWQYTTTHDFVTVKYAPNGDQLWFDTFDQNSGFHTPTSMALDQAGNLFICGGGLSGGLITMMYNNSGVRQWVKETPGAAGHSIKVDGSGGIYVTGSLWSQATGDDIRLIKYDLAGNLVWEKFYDFGNFEYGRLINFDTHSNIIITGNGILPGQFKGWLTIKVDPSGNLLWYKRFKLNLSWEENPYFAITGPADEVYITGNVGVTSGGTTYNGLETIRYNSNGNTAWTADVNLYAGIGKGLALGSDMSVYAVGMYYYSVLKYSQSNITGSGQILSGIPEKFKLEQNYPNPFNPVTKIKFDLPRESDVSIKIHDIIGRQIATIVNKSLKPGYYEINWDGSNYSSGIYFYKLEVNEPDPGLGKLYTETRKMILLK